MFSSTSAVVLLAVLPNLASACVGHEAYQQHIRRQVASDALPLASLVPTMTLPVVAITTHLAGSQPNLSGSPLLPAYTYVSGVYPTQDVVPPTDSAEVKAWVAAIDWSKVPAYAPNKGPNLCIDNPTAVADKERQWWTCGQATASTDIVTCPEKGTWGTSFDDGPSVSTPNLLNYLDERSLRSTFFVIGSRVIGQTDVLRDTYMRGHEIAGHSWSHSQLTTLTNEQIVAELGWTRKLIKDVLGITTLTFRPPQGDIDSRVRAIALQMNLTPVMWSSVTGSPDLLFDSMDFNANAGQVTAAQAFGNWTQFLDTNLPKMSTGFISLEHDLFAITVGLAINYYLPDALGRSPALKLTSVIECQGKTIADAYLETLTTGTLPGGGSVSNSTAEGASSTAPVGGSGASSTANSASGTRSASVTASSTAVANTGGAGAKTGGRGVGAVAAGLIAGVVGVLTF